jgi:hypothetical protein
MISSIVDPAIDAHFHHPIGAIQLVKMLLCWPFGKKRNFMYAGVCQKATCRSTIKGGGHQKQADNQDKSVFCDFICALPLKLFPAA